MEGMEHGHPFEVMLGSMYILYDLIPDTDDFLSVILPS
jgi:hypothetical protein